MRRPLAVTALLGAVVLAGTACSGAPASTSADGPIEVYAAASLQRAFDEIAVAFERAHPDIEVSTVYDGSSTLATQIGQGAPADVFAAADEATMDRVADVVADPRPFARNTLVIAVPTGNPGGVEGLTDLRRTTTVLCAVEVPCGAASATLLSRAGVEVAPASVEQNVAAVLTKVAAGEADAGLVYATDVAGRDDVEAIVPEGADAVVNRYPIAALADSARPDAARAFVAFVTSERGRAILADAGFGAP